MTCKYSSPLIFASNISMALNNHSDVLDNSGGMTYDRLIYNSYEDAKKWILLMSVITAMTTCNDRFLDNFYHSMITRLVWCNCMRAVVWPYGWGPRSRVAPVQVPRLPNCGLLCSCGKAMKTLMFLLTKQWKLVPQLAQSCPRVTFLGPDPTRPDPAKRWPDPNRPAIADQNSDPNRPDLWPDPSPICTIVFIWKLIN